MNAVRCFRNLIFILSFLAAASSCKKYETTTGNKPPVSNAGGDQTIILPHSSTTLDGNASYDPDGKIVTYLWTQIAGSPVAQINNPQQAYITVSNLTAGLYAFQLQVIDDGGLSAKDTVLVTVATSNNKAPVAVAGANQTIMKPLNFVKLDGNLSNDPDGIIFTFQWKTVAGPGTPGMYNFDPIRDPGVQYAANLETGVYRFELTVTDNLGLSARDTFQVTVLADTFVRDQLKVKRFDSLQWGTNYCRIDIKDISSSIPAGVSYQVYIRAYDSFFGSSGWMAVGPVASASYWHEIKNDVLMVHAPAGIDCNFDGATYEVLIKWN